MRRAAAIGRRLDLIVSCLLLALLFPAAASALDVAELTRAYGSPSLEGAGIDASGRKLSFGDLELTFESGRLYAVFVGDEVGGTFFQGRGTFRYVSTARCESVAYRRNVEKATDYEVDSNGAIGDGIETVLVMLSAGSDSLGGGSGWMAGTPAPEDAERFAKFIERWAGDRGESFTAIMPQSRVQPPARPLVVAEIGARAHDLLYVRDAEEWLGVMEEYRGDHPYLKDWRAAVTLSRKPIGREPLQPEPAPFRLVDVDLTLVNPRDQRAEVQVRETFEALAPLRTLELDLDTESIGEVGLLGRAVKNVYTLGPVQDQNGNDLSTAHVRTSLVVQLRAPLAPGDKITLQFGLAGDVLLRFENASYWVLTHGWFPTPSRWGMQGYAYHAVIKVRKPFEAFSCGRTERRWEEGDLACGEFRSTRPIQEAIVYAGDYSTFSRQDAGLVVRVSTYTNRKEDAMAQLAGLALAFIQLYEPLLGEYPFEELNVVELDSYGWGWSPPGFLFITREAFDPKGDELGNLFVEGINRRYAHEVAHAWWGNVALLSDREDQWISEAGAEYYAAVAMGARSKGDFDAAKREWRSLAKQATKHGTLYTANQVESREDREGLIYGQGPLVLHALRHEVGDQTFFTILKSLLRSFPFKPVHTKDLIGITNFITKKDYGPFFERYVLGNEVPEAR